MDGKIAYALAPHVRACVDGDALVFLDLRADRYRSVPVRSAPAIAGLAPTFMNIDTDPSANASKSEALERLGLLAGPTPNGLQAPCVERARAPAEKLAADNEAQPKMGDAASFLIACLKAQRALQSRRLDRILISLAQTKARLGHGKTNIEAAAQTVALYEALRPWYPRARVCLFDALSLMGFMLSQDVAPDLVIGVRTTPFAAHSWIELGGLLVADFSDHCASFTPIAWI